MEVCLARYKEDGFLLLPIYTKISIGYTQRIRMKRFCFPLKTLISPLFIVYDGC